MRGIAESAVVDPGRREAALRTLEHMRIARENRTQAGARLRITGPVPDALPAHIGQAIADGQFVESNARQTLLSGAAAQAAPSAHRYVFDGKHSTNLQQAVLVRKEGTPPVADSAVNQCYDDLGLTFDLYAKFFGRNSIDGKGMNMYGVVHYGQNYDNAMWDGYEMVFGDGDGKIFKLGGFTGIVDVPGHELTHGVTQYTAGLVYNGQSGALNESVSDVFGSMVKQYHLNQTAASADWLIGQGIWAAGINGVALRSMKAPGTAYNDPHVGKDPQPADMQHFVVTTQDSGGVHINSGIPNRAFYLIATELGGHSWERAGQIWYGTLTSPQLHANPSASFKQFADITAAVALAKYGQSVKDVVVKAWTTVGVY